MDPQQLLRYDRQIKLSQIGREGQRKITRSTALIIGMGGLGSPAAMYLAAAGVGHLALVDFDRVDLSNLQRQIIHTTKRIGSPKVFSAKAALEAQNPFVTVRPYNRRFTDDVAGALVADYDLVLDGSDNFDTRYRANRAAAAAGRPLIAAALSQWEGQVGTFAPADGAPCYACVFPDRPAPGLAPDCAEAGVLGPLPGVVGALVAYEADPSVVTALAALRVGFDHLEVLAHDSRGEAAEAFAAEGE